MIAKRIMWTLTGRDKSSEDAEQSQFLGLGALPSHPSWTGIMTGLLRMIQIVFLPSVRRSCSGHEEFKVAPWMDEL